MRPTVIVYSEVSADGKSSHRRGASSKPMMSFEDEPIRRYRHALRAQTDAIMVGSRTIWLDDPQLTVREVVGTDPLRVVASSTGNLPLFSRILNDGGRTLIAVSEAAPKSRIAELQRRDVDVVTTGKRQVDIPGLLDKLGAMGVRSMIVEGGATLLSSFFRGNLVDRLIVQHLPVVFGGDDTPAMVGGPAISSLDQAILLRLIEVKAVGSHAVIIYERR